MDGSIAVAANPEEFRPKTPATRVAVKMMFRMEDTFRMPGQHRASGGRRATLVPAEHAERKYPLTLEFIAGRYVIGRAHRSLRCQLSADIRSRRWLQPKPLGNQEALFVLQAVHMQVSDVHRGHIRELWNSCLATLAVGRYDPDFAPGPARHGVTPGDSAIMTETSP